MRLFSLKKSNVAFLATGIILIIIFFVLSTLGYADSDPIIPKYSAATGLKKYVGYLLVLLALFYACLQILKMLKNK